jgi:hypothetical protein
MHPHTQLCHLNRLFPAAAISCQYHVSHYHHIATSLIMCFLLSSQCLFFFILPNTPTRTNNPIISPHSIHLLWHIMVYFFLLLTNNNNTTGRTAVGMGAVLIVSPLFQVFQASASPTLYHLRYHLVCHHINISLLISGCPIKIPSSDKEIFHESPMM